MDFLIIFKEGSFIDNNFKSSNKANTADLEIYLRQIEDAYLQLSNEFYSNEKFDIGNLNKLSVSDFQNDTDNLLVLLPAYIDFLNEKSTVETLISLLSIPGFRQRVKVFETAKEKINAYSISEKQRGTLYVGKCVNDLFGMRIILDNLNENAKEILNFLKNSGIKSIKRPYERNDGAYHAIHFYIRDNNHHFSWEVQLWDTTCFASNVAAHEEHVKYRE